MLQIATMQRYQRVPIVSQRHDNCWPTTKFGIKAHTCNVGNI
jgi:hypothetical protein